MSAALMSKGEIVLTVASSGIAALLIPGGRTAHSRFAIPINIHESSMCEIPSQDPLAKLIRRAKLIIWNKAPMMHMHDPSFFLDRAILAPNNVIVDAINNYMLDLIPGEEKTYLSYNSMCNARSEINMSDDVHTPEFLNTIVVSGVPNHKLRLKVGVPVMLLRNVDQSSGLCNGTRLIITRMGRYVVAGKIINGSNIGHTVFIPRLSLTPSDKRIPFKFQRKQFTLMVSFAMTINKSQVKSLKYVGVYLPQSIFSHGQLYVALSRVTSRKWLKILITDDQDEDSNTTENAA